MSKPYSMRRLSTVIVISVSNGRESINTADLETRSMDLSVILSAPQGRKSEKMETVMKTIWTDGSDARDGMLADAPELGGQRQAEACTRLCFS